MANEVELERMVVRLLTDASEYNKGMNEVEGHLQRMTRRVGALGMKMSLAITAPLQIMGAVAVKSFADFDDAMTRSTAIMSGITPEIRQQMEDLAKTMSTQTATSATELAESYFFLASAGLDAEQSMMSLATVQQFSAAGAFDMARATDLLTDAQSALGLTVADATQNMENMTRVSDVLIKANTMANATAEQFAISLMTKSGAALRLVNKDIEEGVAILAAYADQGVKAELGGERLAIMLRDLQTASLRNREEWEAMGLSVFDAEGKLLPMVDIIEQLENQLAGASDEQKKLTMMTLGFTDRSVNAITSLLGMSDKIRMYEEQLRSAGGMTEDVANKQMESFSKQMKVLRNNINVVAIEIGEVLAPSVLKLNSFIQKGLDWWHGLNEEQKKTIVNIGKIVALIGPSLVVFAKLMPLVMGTAESMNKMMTVGITAFKAIRWTGLLALLPFIKIIAIVGVIVGVIGGLLYVLVGPESLMRAWDKITTAVGNFVDKALGFLYNFRENIRRLYVWFINNWDAILLDALKLWATVQMNMIHNAGVAIRTIVRLWVAFNGWLKTAMTEVFAFLFSERFQEFVSKALEKVWGMFKTFATNVREGWAAFNTALVTIFAKFPDVALSILTEFGKQFGETFAAILKGEIPDPREFMKEFTQRMAATMGEAVVEVAAELEETLGHVGDKLQDGMEMLQDDYERGASNLNFGETARDILAEETRNLRGITEGFEGSVGGPNLLFDRPTGTGSPIADAVNSALNSIEDPMDTPLGDVASTIEGLREETERPFTVAVRTSGVEALERGSLAALLRVQNHRFSVGGANTAGTPGANASPVHTVAPPPGYNMHTGRMEELLATIGENTDPDTGETIKLVNVNLELN